MMDEPYKSRIRKPSNATKPPPSPDFPDVLDFPDFPDLAPIKEASTAKSEVPVQRGKPPLKESPDANLEPLNDKKLALEKEKTKLESALQELRSGQAQRKRNSDLKAAEAALAEQKANRTDIQNQSRIYQKAFQARRSMRAFLLEEPDIVEFIRADLKWLRVMILMYGAIKGLHWSTHVVEYDEIAHALALDDAERVGALAELRRRPYWRTAWEGEDVVYNTAVYLNDECGPEKNKAKAVDFAFAPSQVCLETPLDSYLMEHLQRRLSGDGLGPHLLRIIQSGADLALRASAFLALLALDPLQAESEWRRSSANVSALVLPLRRLIEQRLGLFRDAVTLYAAGEWLSKELPQLSAKLPVEKQEDILSVFMRSLCEVMPFPPVTGLEAAMHIEYANAELWAGWLAGVGDDPVYELKQKLEGIGKKLHSVDAVVNLHRTHAKRYLPGSANGIDPIPPVWEKRSDQYGEALTFAHMSWGAATKTRFHQGLILYAGESLLDQEALRLDALAATLLLPRESYEEVLLELDKSMADKPHHEIATQLLTQVNGISDSVVRARVLWRLAVAGSTSYERAVEAAARIKRPLQRAVAYERLIKTLPLEISRLLPLHLKAARAIQDLNNRVRALCRHALLLPPANRVPIVSEAINDFRKIPEASQRSATLVLLKQVFGEQPDILTALEALAAEEADPWHRLKSQGLPSFILASVHEDVAHPVQATPVVLHAVLKDMLSLLQQQRVAEDAWAMLGRAETRTQAMTMLLAEIASAEKGILPFTASAAVALESLADQGEVAQALRLLPHLGQTRLEIVERWVNAPPHPVFLPYAHLMAAECDRLRARYMPGVLALLGRGTGVAFYRAALLLHGNKIYIGKPDPQHLASQIELEGLLQIGEFILATQERHQHGASDSASWISMNLVHDSEPVLENLVACVLNNPARRSAASVLLSRITLVTESVASKLVDLMVDHREGPAAVPLFIGFCALHAKDLKTPWPGESYRALDDYWNALQPEVAESARGLPDRIDRVSSVVWKASESPTKLSVEELDAQLRECAVIAPTSSPDTIEDCAVYKLKNDPNDARKAAEEIANSSSALRYLFVWLKSSLAKSINDEQKFYNQRNTLLEIAAACGAFSPAAVFNLVDEFHLEEMLVRAAMESSRFDGRAGAMTLLGYVRNPSDDFLRALRSALRDVAEVQQAALRMVQRLRYVSPSLTEDLVDLLQADDATLSYAASRLLSIVGRHEKTTPKDRDRIIRALSRAIQKPSSPHTVSAFEHAEGHVWVTRLGTLAQRHYQSLLEIVNLV